MERRVAMDRSGNAKRDSESHQRRIKGQCLARLVVANEAVFVVADPVNRPLFHGSVVKGAKRKIGRFTRAGKEQELAAWMAQIALRRRAAFTERTSSSPEAAAASLTLRTRRNLRYRSGHLETMPHTVESLAKDGLCPKNLKEAMGLGRKATRTMADDVGWIETRLLIGVDGTFRKSNLHEATEQLVATWMLRGTDFTLEMGAGVGGVSIAAARCLQGDGERLVVVEPQLAVYNALLANKFLHGAKFTPLLGAVSQTPLFTTEAVVLWKKEEPKKGNSPKIPGSVDRGWMMTKTVPDDGPGLVPVPLFKSVKELLAKVAAKSFQAIIVDIEGAFLSVLKGFPTLIDGTRVIYVEKDSTAEQIDEYEAILASRGFVRVLNSGMHSVFYNRANDNLDTTA